MKTLLLYILILISVHKIFSQGRQTMLFTEKEGLAGNSVRDLKIDKHGILWIATDNGLSSYDGHKFANYYKSDGLLNNSIWSLEVVGDSIYAASFVAGINVIHNGKIGRTIQNDFTKKRLLRKLHFSTTYNTLFVCTEFGLFYLKNDEFIEIPIVENNKNRKVVYDIVEKDSLIYFTAIYFEKEGLYSLDLRHTNIENAKASLIQNHPFFSAEINDDKLIVSYIDSLFVFDIKDFSSTPKIVPLGHDYHVWQLKLENDSLLWIGGLDDDRYKGGIKMLNINNNIVVPLETDAHNSSINAIWGDDTSGITWFGLDNGLLAYKKSPFNYLPIKKGIIIDTEILSDTIFVLTEEGVYYLDNKELVPYISTPIIRKSLEREVNRRFMNYGDNMQNIIGHNGFKINNITAINRQFYAQSNIGSISIPNLIHYKPYISPFFHEYADGTAISYGANLKTYRFTKLTEPYQYSVLRDSFGDIYNILNIQFYEGIAYFATYGRGLFAVDGNKVFRKNASNSGIDNIITDLTVDKNGFLWCISNENHLYKVSFNDSIIIHAKYNFDDISVSGNIGKWLRFADENLYLETDKGLYVLDMYSNDKPEVVHYYNQWNGYPYVDVGNPLTLSDGSILLHNASELVWINPKKLAKPELVIDIYDVSINDKESANDIISNYYHSSTKNISFSFRTLKYPTSKNIEYRYRINDENWIQGNVINLSSISSGHYTIELEAFDKETSQIICKNIEFTIYAPFWLSWWFISIIALLFGAAIYSILNQRFKAKQKRENEKTRLQIENTELQIRSLQMQMNPHFIFNALTSVQNSILDEDTKASLQYLNTLVSIIRTNLENVAKETIPLSSEIEFLNKYINIEKLRFKDKLRITLINNCPDINISIPPMLVQPLIENAIKHGIMPKKEGGEIWIEFHFENDILVVTVEDDGVGFDAMRKQQKEGEKHYGLETISKRIELLNKAGKTNINQLNIASTNSGISAVTTAKLTLHIRQ